MDVDRALLELNILVHKRGKLLKRSLVEYLLSLPEEEALRIINAIKSELNGRYVKSVTQYVEFIGIELIATKEKQAVPEDLQLSLPAVKKKEKKKRRKREKRVKKNPIAELVEERKKRELKIEPKPFSRDVFFLRSHDEMPMLREKLLKKRLKIAREIASALLEIDLSARIKDLEASSGPLDVLLGLGSSFGEEGYIAAIVYEKRLSKNGCFLKIEDETGMTEVFVPQDVSVNSSFKRHLGTVCEMILPDEVLILKLKKQKGLIAEEVTFLGDAIINATRRKEEERKDFSIIFLSDTHVGSKHSIAGRLEKLRKRLREPSTAPERLKESLKRVELVVVGGDLVDGVGVFPGQEAELEIVDPERQYKAFGELFSSSPVEVVAIPGNHDPTTLIVPQPVPEYAMVLKEYGIKISQNPAKIVYDGVKILAYHGRSMEDLVLYTPIELQDVERLMKRIVFSNFLVPILGGKEAMRPDPQRPLGILEDKDVSAYPDVIFMGHIHIAMHTRLGKARLINGGTTQTQPEEKVMNIEPTPGKFVILDLKERRADYIEI